MSPTPEVMLAHAEWARGLPQGQDVLTFDAVKMVFLKEGRRRAP